MIPVNKIPTDLNVVDAAYGGTYTTRNSYSDTEYSWWKDGKTSGDFPHFSIVRKASGHKNDQGTFGSAKFDGNSATVRGTSGGLDGSPAQGPEKKVWILRKFHISVPLGGGVVNGHIFYRVTTAQHVESSGNNLNLLRDPHRGSFSQELGRRSLVWDILATGFYRAAVAGAYPLSVNAGPRTFSVGPQTSATFDDEEGL